MDVFDLVAKITLDRSQYDEDLGDAGKNFEGFGGKIKKGLGTVAKVGGAAVTAVGAAGVALTKTVMNGAAQTAAYGDNIDKMSQKLGMSAQAYQEWDAILQHSGASIESMQGSMKTLQVAAESGNKAFKELGISQKDLANMSPEEMFDATITALQNVDDDEYAQNQSIAADQELTGTTGELTAAEAKSLTGFTAKSFDQVKIAPDGSTVVNIYYDRNSYKVSYAYTGDIIPEDATALPEEASYRYGATVTVAAAATATGYTFSGWSKNGSFEMPAEAVEITGSWNANTNTKYTVKHWLQNVDDDEYVCDSYCGVYPFPRASDHTSGNRTGRHAGLCQAIRRHRRRREEAAGGRTPYDHDPGAEERQASPQELGQRSLIGLFT